MATRRKQRNIISDPPAGCEVRDLDSGRLIAKGEKKYPEHEKLHAVAAKSQACGDFIEWLQHNGIALCRVHGEHDESCYDDKNRKICGTSRGEYVPIHFDIQKNLADYFGIDLAVLETEKRQILKDFCNERSTNAEKQQNGDDHHRA